jgi:hypothetical protein
MPKPIPTTEQQKEQITKLFLSTKDNAVSVICNKVNLSVSRVGKVIDDYFNEKSLNIKKQYIHLQSNNNSFFGLVSYLKRLSLGKRFFLYICSITKIVWQDLANIILICV